MDKVIDISHSANKKLNVISETQATMLGLVSGDKRWSFINVYYLEELRNVYLALAKSSFQGNLRNFAIFCSTELPYQKKPWTYRKVEEYVNALRNFDILSKENILKENIFKNKDWAAPLDEDDRLSLKTIFYSYYRFREIHSWFIDISCEDRIHALQSMTESDLGKKSKMLFSFSKGYRFKDAFITELTSDTPVYYLDVENKLHLRAMRFWDVYLSWGRALGVIEVFSLEQLNVNLTTKSVVNCCYHLDPDPRINFKLYDFLLSRYGSKRVFIPEVIFLIAAETRMNIKSIKNLIVKEYEANRELFSLDNTSEIFISVREFRDNEVILFPLYKDSYISHITIIK